MKKNILKLYLIGFGMGSADIVPGVSGGTIAFISGIYQKLIQTISTLSTDLPKLIFKGKLKEAVALIPFSFILPLGFGLFSAILLLSGVLQSLLISHPAHLWGFFFGLVLASIFLVSRGIKIWSVQIISILLAGAIIAFMITNLVASETPPTYLAFFLSGAVAICAMILPGVSGSFLLVILGKYRQILSAVQERDLMILAVFMLGAVIGLATFAKVLSFLFKTYQQYVLAGLTGFMIGSLPKLWPWKQTISTWIDSKSVEHPLVQANIIPTALDVSVVTIIFLAILGAVVVLSIEKFSNKI